MVANNLLKTGIHLLSWLLLTSLIAAFISASAINENSLGEVFTPWFVIFIFVYVFIFYLNGELLIPKLYLRKKYFLYFLLFIVLLVGINFLQPFDHLVHTAEGRLRGNPLPPFPGAFEGRRPPRGNHQAVDIVSVMLFIMIWTLSSALQIFRQWRDTQEKIARAEAGKTNAELSFLRAQINPHFLFNTLNNIYALAVTKNEYTAEAVMKLSNIMRYVTDEVTEDFVPMESEVECIRNYIDLQRLRLNKKTDIDFSVTGTLERKKIAPLVLMTFVENVFKYGVSNHEPSGIVIRLVSEEKKIEFFCSNKVFLTAEKLERTGIGIANTRQRLQLLYADNYDLNITNKDGDFIVQLTLVL